MEGLPSDAELAADLAEMLPLYARLRTRGGVAALDDAGEDEAAEGGPARSVAERGRHRLHRALDRNTSASRQAKRVLGYVCQGCGFDFEAVYGPAGRHAIEAHHLTPPAELSEDEPVGLDPRRDFAVLCANCHRIMHRKGGPATVAELRLLGRLDQFEAALKEFNGVLL
jgi:5-methylcytosine-specific restriction protein A